MILWKLPSSFPFLPKYKAFFFHVLQKNLRSLQKWWENNFWEKSPVDSADTLQVKTFVYIALSCTVSKINAFLRFMKKFKMAAKMI